MPLLVEVVVVVRDDAEVEEDEEVEEELKVDVEELD